MSWSDFHEILEAQDGVASRAQALACGISASAFDRRMARDGWDRPFPAVVRVPGAPYSHAARTRAALLAVGDRGALTGESALWWYGVIDRPPPSITVLIAWHLRAPDLPGVRVIRSRVIDPDDVVEVRGARVVTPQRAFLDLAGRVPKRRLRALLIDARQRGVVALPDVTERTQRVRRVPGCRRLLRTLAQLLPGQADSILTQEVYEALTEAGLRPDAEPAVVEVRDRTLHPDITLSAYRIAIECDGYGSHAERSALDLDHRKSNAYQTAGWIVLRISWDRLENDWDGFLREVRDAIAAAA